MRTKEATLAAEIEQAQQALTDARTKLRALEDRQFADIIEPKMRANIGNCYKYHNCYSCPQSEADYWWMYVKVVGVRDGSYRVLTFAIDSYHKMQIAEATQTSLEGIRGGCRSDVGGTVARSVGINPVPNTRAKRRWGMGKKQC